MKFKIVKQEDRIVPIHRLRIEQYTTKKGNIKTRPVKVSAPTNGKPKFKKMYDDFVQVQPGDLVLTPVSTKDIIWIGSIVMVLDRQYKVIRMDNTQTPIQFTLRSVMSSYEYESVLVQKVNDEVDVILLFTSYREGSSYDKPFWNQPRVV